MTPLVSVVIPCFNQAPYLSTAIDSVLDQPGVRTEVIVIDDGSDDETPDVAASYGGRIVYRRQDNAGLSAARNAGVALASGDFLHFLDADDFVRPAFLAHMLAAAAESPNASCFHCPWEYVDANGTVTAETQSGPLSDDAFGALLSGNRFPTCAVVVRTDAVRRAGLFEVELRACEDWHLWLRIAAAGASFQFVPEGCACYRRYEGSMSTDYARMWRAGRTVLRAAESLARSEAHRRSARRGVRAYRKHCVRRLLVEGRRSSPGRTLVRLIRAAALDPLVLAAAIPHAGRATLKRLSGARGTRRVAASSGS